MSKLLEVPISAIRENPVALRPVDRNSEGYMGLVDSIRSVGVLNPINVREIHSNGTTEYALVDGLQRLTASKDAGKDKIPAHVLDLDEGQVLIAQIIANVHKIETKPAAYAQQLLRVLAADPMLTITDLADMVKKSTKWVKDRLSLGDLIEKCQQLVDEGKLALTNAYALARLDMQEQVNYMDQALTVNPTEFLQIVNARVKEIRESKRQGRDPKSQEYLPPTYLQKVSDIKSELENPANLLVLLKEEKVTDPLEIVKMTLKWILHLDPVSVKVSRAKWEARKAEKEAEKIRQDEQKNQAKRQEALKKQKEAQEALDRLKSA